MPKFEAAKHGIPLSILTSINPWHNSHLLVFLRKLMFLKYSCQKPVKKNCERPVFLEELQAARNFSKVSLHFIKIPNSLRQVLQTYSETCIFLCATKKSSRSSRQRLISLCQGNIVMKLMAMPWNSYYSQFESEIWR